MSDAAPDFMAALGALAAHKTLPDAAADHAAIRPLLDIVIRPPRSATVEQLTALSKIVGPYLSYEGPGSHELFPGHSAQQDIQNNAIDCLQWPLMGLAPEVIHTLAQDDYEQLLAPYLAWLESSANDLMIDRAIYVGMSKERPIGSTFADFGRRLEIANRRGRGWVDGIDQVIRWTASFGGFGFRSWAQAKKALDGLLEHPHEMVRAEAARRYGNQIALCIRAPELKANKGAPSLGETLRLIAQREARMGNVAAGFIDGFGRDEGLYSLTNADPEIAKLVAAEGIDIRAWVLEICRTGFGAPRFATNVEAWSSYVRDFFWADPDAVRQLVAMGQLRLAFLTASAEPSEVMMPIIMRLAIGADPEVARDARNFLRRLKMS